MRRLLMEAATKLRGNIFDIQGLSIHDGPGCRTVVFLKGCPLNCEWCSNPEGKKPFIEPLYHADKCILDGNCVQNCLRSAISIDEAGNMLIKRELCKTCDNHACFAACLTGALKKPSEWIKLDEVMRIIQRDRQFWGAEGGLTLSGGEPLFQFPFAYELLKRAHTGYIHTAIETCGYTQQSHFEQVIPYLDWIFFDLKHMNPVKHAEKTGKSNEIILNNAKYLSEEFQGRLVFRTPIIPDYNDDPESLQNLAEFILETEFRELNLLPLHLYGRDKYRLLGFQDIPLQHTSPPPPGSLDKIAHEFEELGIKTYVGSDTEF